jgi:CRP/FNR family transcriptional regulator, cyclic AMP receptor protein
MLSTIERILFLQSAEIFGAIAGEDLVPIAMVAQEVRFAPGETFIRRGEVGECLYVIVLGEVAIAVEGDHVAARGPGSVLGEMAVLTSRPRSANCVAVDEVLALRVDRDDFLELLGEIPALALGIISVLGERLEESTQRLSQSDHVHP